jgi:hypothetical protein
LRGRRVDVKTQPQRFKDEIKKSVLIWIQRPHRFEDEINKLVLVWQKPVRSEAEGSIKTSQVLVTA